MSLTDAVGEGNKDSAALAAVESFWKESGKEDALEAAAAKEVPESQPRNLALEREAEDQANAEIESGEVDPGHPDGIPGQNKQTISQKRQEAATPAPSVSDDEPGLDPVLRSLAEDAGWKAEEIDELYKANPDAATRQFTRLADQYAEMSRQLIGTGPGVGTPASLSLTPAQAPQTAQLPALVSDEALKKFAEENGEPAANLLKSIRDHFSAQSDQLAQRVQSFEQKIQAQEMQTVAQEANTVLSGLREKFPTLYGAGDNPQTTTLAQHQKLIELTTMADQIRAGAASQGRSLSVKDAMTRAHYIVSRDAIKSETRNEIRAQVKQRSARATAKPTQRINPSAAGESRSDDAAINAAAGKMAEIGMRD